MNPGIFRFQPALKTWNRGNAWL